MHQLHSFIKRSQEFKAKYWWNSHNRLAPVGLSDLTLATQVCSKVDWVLLNQGGFKEVTSRKGPRPMWSWSKNVSSFQVTMCSVKLTEKSVTGSCMILVTIFIILRIFHLYWLIYTFKKIFVGTKISYCLYSQILDAFNSRGRVFKK